MKKGKHTQNKTKWHVEASGNESNYQADRISDEKPKWNNSNNKMQEFK